MSSNSKLQDFQGETQPEQDVETSQSPSPGEVTIDEIDLPERGFEWGSEVTQILRDALAFIKPADSISLRGEKLSPGEVGYVAAGVEEYLEEYGDRELDTPTSLDVPDSELDTYIAELTTGGFTTASTGRYWGRGIPPERLRQAVSLAVGGGSYRASEVTITACGEYGFIVQYRGDAFAVSPTKITDPGEVVVTNEVAGLTVENEENPTVLNGIHIVANAMEDWFGVTLTGFRERTANKLVFETDHPSGKPIRFSGEDLKRATNPTLDVSDLASDYEYEAWHTDEVVEYEFDPDKLHHEPGGFASDEETKVVLGYDKLERRVTRGRGEQKYGVGVRVLGRPYYLKMKPAISEDYIKTGIYGSKSKSRVANAAFSEPDHANPGELDDPDLGF